MADTILTLTEIVTPKPIEGLQRIIAYLEEGKVLRIEQEDNGAVLLRLSTGKHRMTEISRDIDKETFYYTRHWLPYNIALNTLIAFDVYLDEEYSLPIHKFLRGDIVEFPASDEVDVAYVDKVLTDGSDFYYQLSGETVVYKENQLVKKD